MENNKLMKLSKEDLVKELRNSTNKELLAIYDNLEYIQRRSTNGKLIWEILLRRSGSRVYK